MSDLYDVEVERISGATVTMRVVTVHPDAGPPPKEPTFPMNLLVDLWSMLDRGVTVLVSGVPPMAEAEARELARREPWGPVFRRLRELSHGLEVPVTEAEYDAVESQLRSGGRGTFGGRPIASIHFREGAHYVSFHADESELAAAVKPLVLSYVQLDEQNQDAYDAWPEWPSPATPEALDAYHERLPSVRLVTRLRDADLLGFITPGVTFATAAYF